MEKLILIMKYAPHPFNKFMKLKELVVEHQPLTMEVFEKDGNVKFIMDDGNSYKIYQFENMQSEQILNSHSESLGSPVEVVSFNDSFVTCYKSICC
jgi:hypothetical protein